MSLVSVVITCVFVDRDYRGSVPGARACEAPRPATLQHGAVPVLPGTGPVRGRPPQLQRTQVHPGGRR